MQFKFRYGGHELEVDVLVSPYWKNLKLPGQDQDPHEFYKFLRTVPETQQSMYAHNNNNNNSSLLSSCDLAIIHAGLLCVHRSGRFSFFRIRRIQYVKLDKIGYWSIANTKVTFI